MYDNGLMVPVPLLAGGASLPAPRDPEGRRTAVVGRLRRRWRGCGG
ncbi:hypothetical protein [Streptomyces sp. NPDC006551]